MQLRYIYFNVDRNELDAIDREASKRGRSRSSLVSIIARKSTFGFATFSAADGLIEVPSQMSRDYQIYIRLTQEERNAVERAAKNRNRSPASLVYMVVKLATYNFSDFSIVDNSVNIEEMSIK